MFTNEYKDARATYASSLLSLALSLSPLSLSLARARSLSPSLPLPLPLPLFLPISLPGFFSSRPSGLAMRGGGHECKTGLP